MVRSANLPSPRRFMVLFLIAMTTFGLVTAVAVPVVVVGVAIGVVGVAVLGGAQWVSMLQSGTSEQRMTALSQLETMLANPDALEGNPDFGEFIRPALVACTSDPDSRVVDRANELIDSLDKLLMR